MKRSEIVNGDWIIPAERYKTGKELVIPLSQAAKEIVDGMRAPNGGSADFVFSSNGGRTRIANFSSFKDNLDAKTGIVEPWVLHDLRRTSRSLLSRAGVSADIAERCLGHVIGGVRGVYDRYSYHREKAVAFEKLAQLIEGIVNPTDNVIALGARA